MTIAIVRGVDDCAMQPRRTHTKSRRGCQMCKQRRVKCDEAGPPCGPCEFRNIACAYAAGAQRGTLPGAQDAPTLQSQAREPNAPQREAPVTAEEPSSASVEDGNVLALGRKLELELLHQWRSVARTVLSRRAPIKRPLDIVRADNLIVPARTKVTVAL
ncbi:hypothetical protein ES702_02662 [subsurface metagenome]